MHAGHPAQIRDLDLAERLMHTCYEMYRSTATGLAPELAGFDAGGKLLVSPGDDRNLLRPETVESLFILHRVTGNTTYVEWGWQILRAFEMHSRWEAGGYTSLENVTRGPPKPLDKMESFFIAETLKYLLLLFSPPEVRHLILPCTLLSCPFSV